MAVSPRVCQHFLFWHAISPLPSTVRVCRLLNARALCVLPRSCPTCVGLVGSGWAAHVVRACERQDGTEKRTHVNSVVLAKFDSPSFVWCDFAGEINQLRLFFGP